MISTFLNRLSLNAPHACVMKNGRKRRSRSSRNWLASLIDPQCRRRCRTECTTRAVNSRAERNDSTPIEAILAIDEQAIPGNAYGEYRKRRRNDLEHLVHTEPIYRGVEPIHECGEPAGIAALDAAMSQSYSEPVGQADMRPLPFAKPTVGLQSDQIQKRAKTAVADYRADNTDHPERGVAGFHGDVPET